MSGWICSPDSSVSAWRPSFAGHSCCCLGGTSGEEEAASLQKGQKCMASMEGWKEHRFSLLSAFTVSWIVKMHCFKEP